MDKLISQLSSLIPAIPNLISILKFFIGAGLVLALATFIIKLIFGKDSEINKAICAVIGILFIYMLTITVYSMNPLGLSKLISPLPYIVFSADNMYLFSFAGTHFPVICTQLLSTVVLAFLYNVIDDFMPRGTGFHWLIYRILTVAMTMTLYFATNWMMNTFLPSPVLSYAPTVLTVILFVTFFMGLLKLLLGLILTVVNPIIGAIYAFFFSSSFGKKLSRAVVTAMLLSALIIILNHLGYRVLSVSPDSLGTYAPVVPVLLILWLSISHI